MFAKIIKDIMKHQGKNNIYMSDALATKTQSFANLMHRDQLSSKTLMRILSILGCSLTITEPNGNYYSIDPMSNSVTYTKKV